MTSLEECEGRSPAQPTTAALEDTLELLSDPDALAEIRAARTDAGEGRVFDAEGLRTKYLRK